MDFLKNIAGAVTDLGNTASNLINNTFGAASSALNSVTNFASSIRSRNIPFGGESFAGREAVAAQMGSSSPGTGGGSGGTGGSGADWRVRLNFPSQVPPFASSPVFKPLVNAGGLVFPYTPIITLNSTANYTETPVTHHNFAFISFANSRVSEISISGEFFVEDAVQAQYWLSAVHFLRSCTKMFTGGSAYAGNPPIILYFNAYGDYVFRDVPVVVKSFSMTLPKEVDYITTNVLSPPTAPSGSFGPDATNNLSTNAQRLAGISSAAGLTQAANVLRTVSNVANLFGGGGGAGGGGGGGGSSMGGENDSHVPSQSTLNITLLPIYSRTRVRKFNLDTFVKGGYVKDGFI